jgi:hypothetical protein
MIALRRGRHRFTAVMLSEVGCRLGSIIWGILRGSRVYI